jgi:hypothetical protein
MTRAQQRIREAAHDNQVKLEPDLALLLMEEIMPNCTSCGTMNPDGSKFCASCGKPIPEKQQAPICPRCGTLNPEGGKFCKNCGNSLQPTAPPPPPDSRSKSGAAVFSDKITSQLKMLLWVGAGVYAFSALLGFGTISTLQSMFGMYANTEFIWILVITDLGLCGYALFAAAQLTKGQTNNARISYMLMLGFGVVGALLNFYAGQTLSALMSLLLLFMGFRGYQVLKKETELQMV